jgi:hypothetical protein
VILKIVLKGGYECNGSKGKKDRNLKRISEQFLELVSAFKEASKNFIFLSVLGRIELRCRTPDGSAVCQFYLDTKNHSCQY